MNIFLESHMVTKTHVITNTMLQRTQLAYDTDLC